MCETPAVKSSAEKDRLRLRASHSQREETDMADMTGQVALVTGGVRGIGRAIGERLYARGVTVAAGYSRGKDVADKFCEDHPGRSSVHQGNIGLAEDCERVIQEVLDAHGRLDILVNN